MTVTVVSIKGQGSVPVCFRCL